MFSYAFQIYWCLFYSSWTFSFKNISWYQVRKLNDKYVFLIYWVHFKFPTLTNLNYQFIYQHTQDIFHFEKKFQSLNFAIYMRNKGLSLLYQFVNLEILLHDISLKLDFWIQNLNFNSKFIYSILMRTFKHHFLLLKQNYDLHLM